MVLWRGAVGGNRDLGSRLRTSRHQVQDIDGNYLFSITISIMVIYPYPSLVVITQLFSCIIFINDCICTLTDSPG